MTSPLFARRLARVLARGVPETASPPDDRDATVGAMRLALRARRTRRVRMRWLGGLGAAAAVLLGVFVAARRHPAPPTANATPFVGPDAVVEHVSGGVLVQSGGHTSPLLGSKPIGTGDHVLALLDGQAAVTLASGTRLSVAGGGDLALLDAGPTQVFSLGAGSVRANVTKLRPGERFVIRTTDAEIEVRGTSFRVATAPPDPGCGGGTTTRVEVFEGVVTVRAGATEAALHAGETWPRNCPLPSAASAAASEPTRVPPAAAALATLLPGARAVAASDLAAQNDMFDAAMSARRRGDLRGAIAAFDRLLSRYPASPLAESATAERMKMLGDVDSARAVEAARDYLRRYANGFARSDAEALLRLGPTSP
jgi:hypothetical protein